MESNNLNGIIIVDKPKDFTSFDVIAVLRGILKEKKIGHTGTLDPMATGVLPVMLGKATKTISFLEDTDKEYLASFKLGIKTDTQDITGSIISQEETHIAMPELDSAINKFTGTIEQIPPMYSAVKVNGKKLYELARKSVEVKRKPRKIKINSINLSSFDEEEQTGTFVVNCSKGTYIRTLCEDLGKALGCCGAVLTDLRRTKACSFELSHAYTLEEIEGFAKRGIIKDKILDMDTVFYNYDSYDLNLDCAIDFQNGKALPFDKLKGLKRISSKIYRLYYRDYFDDYFLGLGKVSIKDRSVKIYKNLSVCDLRNQNGG